MLVILQFVPYAFGSSYNSIVTLSHLCVAFAVIPDIPLTATDILALTLDYSGKQIQEIIGIYKSFVSARYGKH